MDCDKILQEFNAIATQNGWHDKHSAKNLAAAISVEAADITMYLLALCDKLNIDLAAAIDQKQQLNRKRFGRNE